MGGSAMGTTGSMSTLSKQQQQGLNAMIGGGLQPAQQSFQNMLQPFDPGQFQDIFQQSYVDPAMQSFTQQVIPAIQQRFVDQGAGSSSALNQALGQSAKDLSTTLGGFAGQAYESQQNRQQQAIQSYLQMLLGGTQQNYQKQGWLAPVLGAGAQIGAAFI